MSSVPCNAQRRGFPSKLHNKSSIAVIPDITVVFGLESPSSKTTQKSGVPKLERIKLI